MSIGQALLYNVSQGMAQGGKVAARARTKKSSPREKPVNNSPVAQPGSYRRVVVKAGTNLLTGGSEALDLEIMSALVGQVVQLRSQGLEVVLVSSGAVAAGRHALNHQRDASSQGKKAVAKHWEVPFRQVLAAVGQSRLMHEYERLFAKRGLPVAQALVTRRDISDRVGYLNIRNTLLSLLSLGVVPILNENDVVAVEELEGELIGDNDTLSALVANIVDADLLVMLGDIAGLYTADPHIHPEAHLIPRVDRMDAVEARAGGTWSGVGRGGMVTKLEAARLATASGTTAVIADGREQDILLRLTAGEPLGTWFSPTTSRLESRQRWMLSVISSRGAVLVDSGAVQALRDGNRSLLPAGVHQVRGDFQRGEVVPILGQGDERVAAGIVNYDAQDVRRIMGLRSDLIGSTLGYQYGDEVVHRNNMVVV